jgi:hypothetical protein
MKDKKKVCREIARRYQKADKKGKGKLLDEYTVTLGYNRDYLAHILSNGEKTRYVRAGDKIIAEPAPQWGRKTASTGRRGHRVPGSGLHGAFGGHRGLVRLSMRSGTKFPQLLAPMLRTILDFLTAESALTPAMSDLPAFVSPRTIDRILIPVKDKEWLRGLNLTKGGTLLRDQLPVRVMFTWDERKSGFFEFDWAAHCGTEAAGQFCQTLTGVPMWVPAGPGNTPCSTAPIARTTGPRSGSGYRTFGTSCPSPSGVLTAVRQEGNLRPAGFG